MPRGKTIEDHYYRKTLRFGLMVVYLTDTYWNIKGKTDKGFLHYDEIKLSKLGQLSGHGTTKTGRKYRDLTGIYPRGERILRVTRKYIIVG